MNKCISIKWASYKSSCKESGQVEKKKKNSNHIQMQQGEGKEKESWRATQGNTGRRSH